MAKRQRLCPKTLRHFNDGIRKLIKEAFEQGWTGMLTASNHVQMRAPDGKTVITMSPGKEPRSIANARADFERWRRGMLEVEL